MNAEQSKTTDVNEIEGNEEHPKEYEGVRGWLLFLCTYLTIISPLLVVFLIYINFDQFTAMHVFSWDLFFGRRTPGMQTYRIITMVMDSGLLMFGIVAGIRLWRIKPNSVKLTRLFFVAVLAESIVLFIVPYLTDLPTAAKEALFQGALINFVRTIVLVSIWLAYLRKSKRVKFTYGIPA